MTDGSHLSHKSDDVRVDVNQSLNSWPCNAVGRRLSGVGLGSVQGKWQGRIALPGVDGGLHAELEAVSEAVARGGRCCELGCALRSK